MIADKLSNSNTYYALGNRFKMAFDYLQNTDLTSLTPGTYKIDGDNVFVLIQEYDTKALENGRYEAHEKYIDIQYIFSGVEYMGYAPVSSVNLTEDGRPSKDILYYKDDNNNGTLVKIETGMFAMFFPQDAHMPNITCGSTTKNRKAVVKILAE